MVPLTVRSPLSNSVSSIIEYNRDVLPQPTLPTTVKKSLDFKLMLMLFKTGSSTVSNASLNDYILLSPLVFVNFLSSF